MKRVMIRQQLSSLVKWMRAKPATSALITMVIVCFIVPTIIWQIEETVEGGNLKTFGDGLWYGIVTMLTVGYGDKYAVTTSGRLFASFMMIVGVIGMAIVTARISSIFLEKALRDRRGLVDSETLNQHFVICGWKSEMTSLLSHIIESSGINPEQIVMVNNAPEKDIDSLHEFPKLRNVRLVRGDFFQADVLIRAAPERARKILILADATPRADGSIPTRTEADARTIMTAMTISNIAKGAPVAAEILDSQMDQYLRLAHVHEIIYSRDYARMILAMASTGTGVANIFHDLLDPASSHIMTTAEIPSEAFNMSFQKLRELFSVRNPDMTLLGILENSGNSHLAKEVALRRAQQTPNIAKLVENLQSVKSLRFNRPYFSPPDAYVVPEGAMAIVIRQRGIHA